MFENRSFHNEIDILWYQSGAEKNKTIQNIIWLILCYNLIKNDKQWPNNAKQMPKIY